jgi:hypothetical protein
VKGNFQTPDLPSGDHYRVVWAELSAVIALQNNFFDDAESSFEIDQVHRVTGNAFGVVSLQTTGLEHINTVVCFANIIPSDSFSPSSPFSNSPIVSQSSVAAPSLFFSGDSDLMDSDMGLGSKRRVASNEFAIFSSTFHSSDISDSPSVSFSFFLSKSSSLLFSEALFITESVRASDDFNTSRGVPISILFYESLSLDSSLMAIRTLSFLPSRVVLVSLHLSDSSYPSISMVVRSQPACLGRSSPFCGSGALLSRAELSLSMILKRTDVLQGVSGTLNSGTSQTITAGLLAMIIGPIILLIVVVSLIVWWHRRFGCSKEESSVIEANVELGFTGGNLSTELNFATYNGLFTTEQGEDLFVMADDTPAHFAFSCSENL